MYANVCKYKFLCSGLLCCKTNRCLNLAKAPNPSHNNHKSRAKWFNKTVQFDNYRSIYFYCENNKCFWFWIFKTTNVTFYTVDTNKIDDGVKQYQKKIEIVYDIKFPILRQCRCQFIDIIGYHLIVMTRGSGSERSSCENHNFFFIV